MGSGYETINARVRGMMGHLLPPDSLRQALAAPDTGSWLGLLRRTPYEPFLAGAGAASEKSVLFEAIDRGMADRTRRLSRAATSESSLRLSALDGMEGPLLGISLLLAEWDLANLVAILAGVLRHSPASETVTSTLGGGLLGGEQLAELARARDLREVSDRLSTWGYPFHAEVRAALGRRGEAPSLTSLRLDLVRAFYSRLAREAERVPDPVLSRYLSVRIDHINLSTALSWQALPVDRGPEAFFLRQGARLSLASYKRILAAPSPDAAVAEAPAPYRAALGEALVTHEGAQRLSVFWQALDRSIVRRFTRTSGVDPLGASLPLDFILRLRREGTVLKLGLTRLALGVPPEPFLEMVGDV